MRLIGLVTFIPVNLQLVSEGNNGRFAEVLSLPLEGGSTSHLSHVSAGCHFHT